MDLEIVIIGKLIKYFMVSILICSFTSCASIQTMSKSGMKPGNETLTVNDVNDGLVTLNFILTIDRPVETVFAYLIDPLTVPEWQTDIYKQIKITAGPMRTGTVLLNSKKSLWGSYEYKREVVDFVPLKIFGFFSHDRSLEFEISYYLEPAYKSTNIEISGKFKKPMSGLYSFLPQWILKYGITKVFIQHNKLLKMNIEKKFVEIEEVQESRLPD